MNLEVLGRIHDLGLGFTRTRGSGGEEKEKRVKMNESGLKPLLYAYLGRVDPNPTHSLLCMTVDQDPDGSGSIQRSWSVGLIRIHQICGFGPFTHKLLILFQFLVFFLLFTPFSCCLNLRALILFLKKIPKNYHVFLDIFSLFGGVFIL